MKVVFIIWIIMVLFSMNGISIQGKYIMSPAPNKTRFNSDSLCAAPYENKMLYQNCKPLDKSNFPATSAICDCLYCTEKMYLICYDTTWYDHNVNICGDAIDYGVCGPCYGKEKIPDNIKCDTNGKYYRRVSCYCRNNCKETILKCGANGKWEIPECNDHPVIEKMGHRVIAEITNNSYTFSCAPGYSMIKSGYANCSDGVLDKKYPFCVRQKDIKDEEMTIEITTTSITEETTTELILRSEIENENNVTLLSLDDDANNNNNNTTLDDTQYYTPNIKNYYIIFIVLVAILISVAFIMLIIVAWCKKTGRIPKKSSQTAAKRQSKVQSMNFQ